jgi:hypothetical protein
VLRIVVLWALSAALIYGRTTAISLASANEDASLRQPAVGPDGPLRCRLAREQAPVISKFDFCDREAIAASRGSARRLQMTCVFFAVESENANQAPTVVCLRMMRKEGF